jgi:hypothetical protein
LRRSAPASRSTSTSHPNKLPLQRLAHSDDRQGPLPRSSLTCAASALSPESASLCNIPELEHKGLFAPPVVCSKVTEVLLATDDASGPGVVLPAARWPGLEMLVEKVITAALDGL